MHALLGAERPTESLSASASSSPAVSVRNLSKSFALPHQQYHTLKERVLHPLRKHEFDVLPAVQDVSLSVAPGEFFGIVGRNGSGKSTLLKCLAGIYDTDTGEISLRGRLSPFIELGVGFNPDLTARDNVIINAIMLGLTRRQARERFDSIIAFAELEQFIDLKLKNYSSGMYVRLAFATAVQVDADILLIDEVLAVGDAGFQQKCFDEFTRLRAEGRTILFVTHDMGAIERFCDRAMLLERGRIVEIGQPAAVARAYNKLNFDRLEAPAGPDATRPDPPAASVRLVAVRFEDARGEVAVTAQHGEDCRARLEVEFDEPIEEPIFAITLENETGHAAFSTSTDVQGIPTGRFDPGTSAVVTLCFRNWLAPGRYRLIATVARAGLGAHVLDRHMDCSIIVMGSHPGGGLVDLPSELQIERASDPG